MSNLVKKITTAISTMALTASCGVPKVILPSYEVYEPEWVGERLCVTVTGRNSLTARDLGKTRLGELVNFPSKYFTYDYLQTGRNKFSVQVCADPNHLYSIE